MNDYHQFSPRNLQASDLDDISNGEMSTLPSAALLSVFFEKTLDAILIVDDEGKHIDANPAACKLFGLPQEELLTGYISDFCELGFDFVDTWRNFLQEGSIKSAFCLRYRDGTVKDITFTATNFFPHRHLLILQDITEHRQVTVTQQHNQQLIHGNKRLKQEIQERQEVEATIQKTQAFLSQVLDTISDPVFVKNGQHQWLILNDACCKFIGIAREELLGKSDYDFFPKAESDVFREKDNQVMSTGVNDENEEYLTNAQGETRIISTKKSLLRDTEGNKIIVGVIRDITDHKLAALALKDSEERFRTLFEQGAIGTAIADLDGRFLQVNQKFCEIVGYSDSELLNLSCKVLTYPEDQQEEVIFWQLLLRGEITNYVKEKRYVRKDSSLVWVKATISLMYSSTGQCQYVAGVVEDIDQRKQAEEVLYRREQQFRALVENSPDIIVRYNSELRFLYVNPAMEQATGISQDVFMGKTHQELKLSDEKCRLWDEAIQSVFLTGEERIIEFDFMTPKGLRFYQSHLVSEVDQEGEIESVLSISRDITESKLAQETLSRQAKQERLLRKIQSRIRQSLELDDVLNTMVYEVRKVLNNDRVLLFRFCKDGVGRVVAESVAKGIQETIGREVSNELFSDDFYQVYCQGQPRIVNNVADDKLTPYLNEVAADLGVKSKLVIPILYSSDFAKKDDRCLLNPKTALWGLIGIHDCTGERQWQQWEIDLVCYLSNQLGIALQQSELYQRLEVELAERKRAELALQKAKQVAEVANLAKSEFLMNISHELRTPLNGILGYTQILKQDDNLVERQQNSLKIIYQCGAHLLTLIDDILDLSKVEAQKLDLYPHEFNFPSFLSTLVELFRMRAQQKGIFFSYECLCPLPLIILADEKRLRQVLINLLSNAIKFTERGGVIFRVSVAAEDRDELTSMIKVRFQVEDTGIGIDPSQVEQIFLPFCQVSERFRFTEGTGLGLAISQKLLQLMGTSIQVRSYLSEGSIFWFDLDVPQVTKWYESRVSESRRLVGFKGEKRKVLIVDDNQVNRSFLQDLLERFGLDVCEAVDGQDCLHKAITFQPDLILMDLVMPVMSGFDASRCLRQLLQKEVVLIALSASADEASRQQSLAAGFQDFLAKPVEVKHLLDLILIYLGIEPIYEEFFCPSEVELSPLSSSLITPPLLELNALFQLVQIGDITSLLNQLERLEKLDKKLEPFTNQLRQLTKGFKLKQLRELLQQYLNCK